MDNKINAWLEDILRSIDEIFDFLPENRDFFEFQKDIKTKKAVERNIEIIGEAVNRLTNYKNTSIEIQNARQIIGTRNRIAHEYDNISDEVIWTIIVRELPKLKDEIIKLRK
ncbi:HepT-like ribonuclease domain-containing protein [Aquiflexum lacus]|uniref:HepT-like ribonuclease domain-containing protein n=1 Tax=Aquiflexum lacus TaxID=2483805 RepID=UPI001895D6E7|nr:HepT-like ribonuclease domain-containing protein [Aquiflexum lacus]